MVMTQTCLQGRQIWKSYRNDQQGEATLKITNFSSQPIGMFYSTALVGNRCMIKEEL